MGEVVDRGTIDRATPDIAELLHKVLRRHADPGTNTELCRYVVAWPQGRPRGRYAVLFRNMHADCVI